tara:strand:+ start:5337 stop:7202 length:1866 start_codon:yes stop_codon:yes gene_type:complete
MDQSVFSSFLGTHKMITRYKKQMILKKKMNFNDRKKSSLSSESDEDYEPDSDSPYSSSSSLFIAEEEDIDKQELRELIKSARTIISTIANKYTINGEHEYDLSTDNDEEDEDDNDDEDEDDNDEEDEDDNEEEDEDHTQVDDENLNEEGEQEDVNNKIKQCKKTKIKFSGLEILASPTVISPSFPSPNDSRKINKQKCKLKEIDRNYLKLFDSQQSDKTNKSKHFRYFKTLEEMKKNEILNDEVIIKKINEGEVPIRFKILKLPVDIHTKAQIMRRLESLESMDNSNSDYHKINEWISTLLTVPFNTYCYLPVNNKNTKQEIQEYLVNTKQKLDKSIYGHNEAKIQILQLITRWITNPVSKGKIIGLQGPMGNGKTTLVKNGICEALDRPFISIPLGGASDSALLEGHSYTYEGSICGQIVKSLIDTKCMNPVFYFDELDKVSECSKGKELINKLIHLTDHSQNDEFTDIYFSGISFDLSRALFIFSFNDETKINPILKDRIHIIRMKGLKQDEKQIIARDYLVPTICTEVGFLEENLIFPKEIIRYIISCYTKEEGVRTLKRCIEEIISKINILRYIEKSDKIQIPFMIKNIEFPLTITTAMVNTLLTKEKDNINVMMYL